MKKIVLENFKNCTLKSIETNNPDYYHRIVAGFTDIYKYGFNYGDLKLDNIDFINPIGPKLRLNTDYFYTNSDYGYPIDYVDNVNFGGPIDTTVVTQYGRVVTVRNRYDLGYPNGSRNFQGSPRITQFANNLVVSLPNTGLFRTPIDTNPSWTSIVSQGGFSDLLVFNNWLYAVQYQSVNVIRAFNSNFVEQTPAFNKIVGPLYNLNENYIGIVNNNNFYIWDGSLNSSYFKIIPFGGKFINIVKLLDSYFLITEEPDGVYVYRFSLDGFQLIKVFYGIMHTFNALGGFTRSPKLRALTLSNYIIMPISISGDYNQSYILFYNPYENKEFLMQYDFSYYTYGLFTTFTTSAGLPTRLGLFSTPIGNYGAIRIDFQQNTSYSNVDNFFGSETSFYQSNWITFDNPITIRKIEVFYNYKPFELSQNFFGEVNISIETKNDFDRNDINSYTLRKIDKNSPLFKEVIDVNKTCNKFRLNLSLRSAYTNQNYFFVVKKIIIYYDDKTQRM